MASDGNDLEIVFELHSRNKLRSGGTDDKANIMGIVDTSDTCSSWLTFKSYLAQSIGVTEDISVAYVNDTGEEVPIESESDFRAALKYSKLRASRGQRIILKIDKRKLRPDADPAMGRYGFRYLDEEPTSKDDDEIVPPAWFVKYMEQFREKLIEAVVDTVIELDNMKEKKKLKKIICGSSRLRCDDLGVGEMFLKEARKKHRSDVDDVSDGQAKPARKERKGDRSLCKVEGRSRRSLEKKSGGKYEKHHHPSKKSIAALKRSYTGTYKKIDPELFSVTVPCSEDRPVKLASCLFRVAEKPKSLEKNVRWKDEKAAAAAGATPAMGAMALSDYSVTLYPKRGQIVTYKWQVMNTGLYGWSDETELRYTWGCSALVPLNKVIECPRLKPGECGVVEVTLQAPDALGSFESYWCFFHKGHRFGQWLNLNCKVCSTNFQFPADYSPAAPADKTETVDDDRSTKLDELHDEPETARTERVDAERILNYGDFIYDSDSDDISVISGTISGDSSEQDEYVVVRMPGENEPGECGKIVVDGAQVTIGASRYPKFDKIVKERKESDLENTEALKEESKNVEASKSEAVDKDETSDDVEKETVEATEPVLEPAEPAEDPPTDSKEGTSADDDADVVESIIGRFNFIINNFNTLSGESIRRFLEYARSVLADGKIGDEKKRKIVEKQAQVLQNKLDVRTGLPRPTIPLSYPGHGFSEETGYTTTRSSAWSSTGPGYQYGFACSGPHFRPTCPEEAFGPSADGRFPPGPFVFSPPGFVFNFPVPTPAGGGGSVPPQPAPEHSPPGSEHSSPGSAHSSAGSAPKPDKNSNKSDGRHFTFTSSGSGFESSSKPKNPSPPPPPPPPPSDETADNSRSSRYAYVFDGTNGNPIPSAPGHDTPPTANGVNIIPETLIEGAVNVASSAYNTAKNVFGMFRNAEISPTDPLNRFANSNWRHEPRPQQRRPAEPEPDQLPRRSIHRCLEILKEMGFNNRALNIKLLRRYDNDLPTVISKLI